MGKAKHPNASMTEMSKLMGDAWKALDAGVKKTYQDRAAKEKSEYDTKLATYKKTPEYAAHTARVQEQKIKDTKTKFRKDENAPKRPMSGYFLWMNSADGRAAYVAANPTATPAQIGKALGEQWKTVDEAVKQKYQKQFEEAKKQYKVELEAYQKTDSYKKYEEEKQAFKAGQSAKRKKLEGKVDEAKKKAKKTNQ